MSQRKLIWIILLCISLAGCSLFGSGKISTQEKLEKNRQKWQQRDISNYQFNLFVGCFCAFVANPVRIVVKGDTVSAVLDPKTGKRLTFPNSKQSISEDYADYSTINELFETIEHAIKHDAYHLEVKYNSRYGYPEQISINFGKNIADDFVNYQVTDFKLITPDT